MQKDPEYSNKQPKVWANLPPRFDTAEQLMSLIDGPPKKFSGFCHGCDSVTNEEWCTATSTTKDAFEIRHLADDDIGILRPSELALIQKWILTMSSQP